jgi:hypothetical protein
MKQAAPAVRDLARLLLKLEANRTDPPLSYLHVTRNVFENLRTYLTKIVGIAGFQALLARALALATAEMAWLETVRVQDDATFLGFTEAAERQPAQAVAAGSTAILAQLLGLLVIFVGDTLTRQMVQDIWPEWQGNDWNADSKETPA